jgi:hypothetical protein
MLGTFRRVKNELGDDLLKFVIVSQAQLFLQWDEPADSNKCTDWLIFFYPVGKAYWF